MLEAFQMLFPHAAVYTLLHDPRAMPQPVPVHTSPLQRLPGVRRYYPALLPMMPWAAGRLRVADVDLVLCSDAAIAKAMRVAERSVLVCYCHSPMRYVWDLRDEYGKRLPAPLRPLWRGLAEMLRRADRAAARRVDLFIANSAHVADRIARNYGRESVVVHPPVDLPAAPCEGPREDFYLWVGQPVSYKRLDLAIEACERLGRSLVVVGEGTRRCVPAGSPRVVCRDWLSDDHVRDLYRRARGLLFPGEEDFGIVPVEAMAHGCPVIAYARGGACETVQDGVTGVWCATQDAGDFAAAIERCESLKFDPRLMHAAMQRFSLRRFLERMTALLIEAAGRGRAAAGINKWEVASR